MYRILVLLLLGIIACGLIILITRLSNIWFL